MPQYDIFVSYRREDSGVVGTTIASLIAAELKKDNKFRVFIDSEIRSGEAFDSQIGEALRNCTDFLLILTDGCLNRCCNADDWVAAEISMAKQLNKNIIPIYVDSFEFPQALPEDLQWLTKQEAPTPRLLQREKNAVASCVSLLIQGKHLKSKPRTKLIENAVDGIRKVSELRDAVGETFGGNNSESSSRESNVFSLIGGIFGVSALAAIVIFGLTYLKKMGAEEDSESPDSGSSIVDPRPPKLPLVADVFTDFGSQSVKSFAQAHCFIEFAKLEELEGKSLDLKIEIESFGDNVVLREKAKGSLKKIREKAEKIRKQIVRAYEEKDDAPKTYTIVAGDSSLNQIAAKLGCSAQDLQEANPGVDFSASKLRRGMEIRIPESARERMRLEKLSGIFEGETYEVVQGDTATKIAAKLGCSVEELKKANPTVDFSTRGLRRGMKLNVPEKE